MDQRMSSTEARRHFGQMLSRVADGDTVIIERSGQPLAAAVPIRSYRRWVEARKERFSIVDSIRAKAPGFPEEKVEADIAEAIAAVRAGWRIEGETNGL